MPLTEKEIEVTQNMNSAIVTYNNSVRDATSLKDVTSAYRTAMKCVHSDKVRQILKKTYLESCVFCKKQELDHVFLESGKINTVLETAEAKTKDLTKTYNDDLERVRSLAEARSQQKLFIDGVDTLLN